ncbi:hypothetical protein KAR91_32490 [Candidatus Pacearchaeota archaeon]|nr:hypothetical protein [Candidatus Pacearchaeota archaeon]
MAKTNLLLLNKILPAKPAKKGSKRRRVTDKKKNDRVSEVMDSCNSAAEMGTFAMKCGITEKEIRERAKSASGLGQFRMVLSIRIRGIAGKIARAKAKGITLSKHDAANPVKGKKVVKKTTKKATKKTVAKKTTKKKTSKKKAKK